MNKSQLQYEAIFMPQDDGGFTVEVPGLPGCISEGDTLEEAKNNIEEAIELYIDALRARGKATPRPNKERYFTIGVSVKPRKRKAYA